MKKTFYKILDNAEQFLENMKIVSSLSILIISFSIFYFLVLLPSKKIDIITDFEYKKSSELLDCIYKAKARYDNVILYNCKSETQKQKNEGVCVTPNHIKTRAETVYKEDRELCIDIYKNKLNI